jgi:uncharacterized NAD(P)/FAD-binding protein YdhS
VTCMPALAPRFEPTDSTATPVRRTIAVVGGGASATAFLSALVKQISAQSDPAPDVLVFEPASLCGPGVAYGDDTEMALLNRPVPAMSVDYMDRGHFRRWLAQNRLLPARPESGDSPFVPRSWFGWYLTEMFRSACEDLRNLGGSVQVCREKVRDVRHEGEEIVVLPERSGPRWTDEVVLCLGSVPARDVYRLSGAPGYMHHPYPVRELADGIAERTAGRPRQEGEGVLVLGSGLTAIDVALEVSRRPHAPQVTIASRSGALPDIRHDFDAGDIAPDLVADVRSRLARRDALDLDDLARLLDDALNRRGTTLREALRPFLRGTHGAELLRARMDAPGPAAALQRCVVALTPWYSRLWRALDPTSSREFNRRYGRVFGCLRSPMPAVNARRLLALSRSGAITFRSGITDVTADAPVGEPGQVSADGARFTASFGDGETLRFGITVNATGRGIDVGAARPGSLVEALSTSGIARPHPLGGLDVDPDTNEVLNARGERSPLLHVVGDLSSGVHFHTSSMEYVATQARRVAEQVTERLRSRTGVLL